MNEDNNKMIDNEEISLIDLFSVLIKYRKFIICGTLVFSLLLVASFFLINFCKGNSINNYNVQISIPVSNKIKYIGNVVNYDLLNDTIVRFKDLNYIAKLNEKYNVFYYNFNKPNFSQLKYNEFINKKLTDGFYNVKFNSTKSNLIIDVKTYSVKNVRSFINEYIQKLNTEYREHFEVEIKNRIGLLQEILNNNKNDNDIIKEKYELETIDKDTVTLFDSDFSIFVTKDNNYVVKILIIFFASLFIFVFLAFLLNAIKNIKADKVASSKIKSAWNDGKKLFP